MPKPILFLDVDGVINAFPPIKGEEVVQINGFPICIPPGTKERVAALVEVFEPVWATTWRKEAHPCFYGPLGLGEEAWPHIDFHTYKLLSIIEYAADIHLSSTILHPWVWIDDDGGWEMRELGLWHDKVKTLVLEPDPAVGLTDEHVEKALALATKAKNLEEEGV